jgi:hypothetical protein
MPGLWAALPLVRSSPVLGWVHHHDSISGYFTFRPGDARVSGERDLPVSSRTVSRVRPDTPYGRSTGGSFINGSLRTLPYEIRCYLVVGLLAVVARKFGNRQTMTIAWVVSLALVIGYAKRVDFTSFVIGPYADRDLAVFLFIFLTGTLVAAWAKNHLFGWMSVAAGARRDHRSGRRSGASRSPRPRSP